jgi:hypothetical protein
MFERDERLTLLNSLLTTPHRDLASLCPLHQEISTRDPLFYVRLAAWYAGRGEVRDHKEMFVITLCRSSFEGHRDVGLALLRGLPPYEVVRVVDFIKGRPVRKKGDTQDPPAREGLCATLPRSLRTEVERYLREREADPRRLDSAVLHARKALKRLYAVLHVRPSPRAQALLFDDEPPADSTLFAVRAVARSEDPAEQARLIVENRLPYRVASSLVKAMTPEVVRALVEVMSSQELINNLGSLKERGALADPATQSLVNSKLEAARKDDRVSAFKTRVAAEAAGLTGEVADRLEAVTEARVRARGRISRPTAVLIDKSSSMHEALEVGRQLSALISSLCETGLFAYAFDTRARPLAVSDSGPGAWDRALAGVYASGATACGAGLEALAAAGQRVEQIVLITDGNENARPSFRDAFAAYCERMQVRPGVILVKVGQAGNTLDRACKDLGIAPSPFEFRGDYYALTNLIPLLSQPSMAELLLEIMETPLPSRRSARPGGGPEGTGTTANDARGSARPGGGPEGTGTTANDARGSARPGGGPEGTGTTANDAGGVGV